MKVKADKKVLKGVKIVPKVAKNVKVPKKKQVTESVVDLIQKVKNGGKKKKIPAVEKVEKKKVTPKITKEVEKEASPKKEEKKQKKSKKSAEISATPTENEEYDTELPEVLITPQIMKKAVAACKKMLDLEQEKKKSLFSEDMKIALHVIHTKIPKCPSRVARVQLAHPIYKKGDEICLIVKDLNVGAKKDFEPTVNHWEEVLRKQDVKFISKIIPFNQLKKDYKPFEMKSKLAKQFDRFLVDARISGHVFSFLGKSLIRKCKNPTPTKLENEENVKVQLEKALKRVQFKQVNSGAAVDIPVGVYKMPNEEITENALSLVEQLKVIHPGGWLNIKKILLRPMAPIKNIVPIYISKINPNAVPVPNIVGPKEKFAKKQKDTLEKVSKKYEISNGKMLKIKKGKPQEVEEEMSASDVEVDEPESDDDEEEAAISDDSGRDSDDSAFNDD